MTTFINGHKSLGEIETRIRHGDIFCSLELIASAVKAWFIAKKTDNPQDLERWLRENKLNLHLVAGSKGRDADILIGVDRELDQPVKTRTKTDERLRYAVWFLMGPSASTGLLDFCDSYEENFKRLRLAGFLHAK
jgi:hypothetical protein